jgi:hypothetical protein
LDQKLLRICALAAAIGPLAACSGSDSGGAAGSTSGSPKDSGMDATADEGTGNSSDASSGASSEAGSTLDGGAESAADAGAAMEASVNAGDGGPAGEPMDGGGADATVAPAKEGGLDSALETSTDASDAGADGSDATDEDAVDAGQCARNSLATSWDVTADFSGISNPCGVWTYGYTKSLGSTPFIVFTGHAVCAVGLPVEGGWIDPSTATLLPEVWKNVCGSGTIDNVAPGQVSEHPGPNGEYSTSRWTAPRAGTYSFTVNFSVGNAVNGTSKNAAVLHGTTVLFQAATSTNPTYSTTLTMAAGDTFDAAVGLTGSETYTYGNTPITFLVTQN